MTSVENWARNQRWFPREIVVPSTEDDVLAVVRRAASEHMTLKVVGGGHSWSDAAVTSGIAMRLDRLDRVLATDDESITVQAGIRLNRIVAALDVRSLALPVIPTITEQSAAGAVATDTHGSSLQHGGLSSLVTHLRLVTASGDVLDFGPGEEHLDAARVHLGALGVVTRLTFRVVPEFWLRETMTPVDLEDIATTLPEIATSAEYVKIWWFPHTQRCTVFRYEKTTDRAEVTRAAQSVQRNLNRFVFPALLGAGRRVPALIPRISRGVGSLYARPKARIGRSHDVLTAAMPPVNRQIEYSVPLEDGPEAFTMLSRLISGEHLHVNFPAEVRFSPASNGWMSPSFGRATLHLGAYMAPARDLDRYFMSFERAMLELGGRPHPGKEHAFVPGDHLPLFERGSDFRDLAFRLDPTGMFANPFVDRWLGHRH